MTGSYHISYSYSSWKYYLTSKGYEVIFPYKMGIFFPILNLLPFLVSLIKTTTCLELTILICLNVEGSGSVAGPSATAHHNRMNDISLRQTRLLLYL